MPKKLNPLLCTMQPQKASITTLLFLIIYLHILATKVSSIHTLKPGDNLTLSSQLVSSKRVFTLGFYTPQGTNNTYIAVWYNEDAMHATNGLSHHPLWIGNRDKPVSRNSDPILTMSPTGSLMIISSGGGGKPVVELYSSQSRNNNASVTLLDTGNFVVQEMLSNGSSGEILWQSFDHPTDNLLPGMKLGVDHRSGKNWTVTSWFGQNDPSPGAFALEWNPSSQRLLIKRRGVVYWNSGELKADYYGSHWYRKAKVFENFIDKPNTLNLNYNFSSVTSDDEEYFRYSLSQVPYNPGVRELISGWWLNYKGDLHSNGYYPAIAMASLCYGYNSEANSDTSGCELWQQPKCRNRRETFRLKSGDFKQVDGREVSLVHDRNSSRSVSDCREFCWNDCDCFAYVDYEDEGKGCLYWRGKNLEFEQSVDGSELAKYFLENAPSSKETKRDIMIILVVLSTVVLLSLGTAFFVVRKVKHGKMKEDLHELLTLEGYTEAYAPENGGGKNHDLRMFTYASIMSATKNFSSDNKLGQGGFGPVYKGRTPEGQDIAVKLLSRQSGQGLIEFKTELILISKLQHVNLVKLVGFCIHGDDKMIIYDYMHNKSLDFFLFSPSKIAELDWPKRFNIIEGTAQGLLYLHKYSRLRIIHRDLKPSNILLDENMNPKISDFGLARIFKQNASDEANTNRRVGTYGYMAPEYAMQGIFSVKSDVYSFGVLVLEIVSGRKNNSFNQNEGSLNLVEYAWELWRKDSAVQLMDPTLRDTCIEGQLQRCIHIGLLCVENHAADRPTTEDVISMLKNEIATLSMPKNPSFITRNSVVELQEVKKSTPENLSANELTLSEIEGR